MEIITDSAFATIGAANSLWVIQVHEGVLIAPTVSDGVLSLDISQTRGANWHGELRYAPFPVQAGEVFTVSFAVRARHPFTFSVWLGQNNAPYASLVTDENHFGAPMMTEDWQRFTHTWRPFVTEQNARANFVFGQIDNVVEIKDVSLLRQ